MAGSLSDYTENLILDHVLKGDTYTFTTDSLFVGLSTVSINDAATGGDVTEPSTASAYARVTCNTWDTSDARATENTDVITFVESTGDWGTITDWFVANNADVGGGNIVAYGTFSAGKAVGTGDNPSIAAGGIDISVNSGGMSTDLADKILDHIFQTAEYTAADTLYVGLSTGTIDDDTTGGAVDNTISGAYARVECNTWTAAAAGASENTNAITFTTATASWGTVTHFMILDHLTNIAASDCLIWGTVDPNRTIGIDDVAEYAAGALDITLA